MKVAVVTGSNSGVGLCTAQSLAKEGFTVVFACRSEARALEAIKQTKAQGKAELVFLPLDTSSISSVREFAEAFGQKFTRLDALVLNAGVGYVKSDSRTTADGLDTFFQTNYLGHFYLTQLLLPALKKTVGARVVALSSVLHRDGKNDWAKLSRKTTADSYPSSKLALTLFAYELARRSGLPVVAANPGAVQTNIWAYMHGRKGLWVSFHNWVENSFFLTAQQGAATSVWGCLQDLPAGECVYVSPYNVGSCCSKYWDSVGWFNGPTVCQPSLRTVNEQDQKLLWEFSLQTLEGLGIKL